MNGRTDERTLRLIDCRTYELTDGAIDFVCYLAKMDIWMDAFLCML